MIEPFIGFVPRPVPAVTYVIYCEKRGDYAELNPFTNLWNFTPARRFATPFADRSLADAALAHVIEDCGDLWHLTREDLRVVEKP